MTESLPTPTNEEEPIRKDPFEKQPVDEGPAEKDPLERAPTKSKSGSGLSFLALILALVSLGFSAWLWWQNISAVDGQADRLAADSTRQEKILNDLEGRMTGLDTRLTQMANSDTDPRLASLENSMDGLQASRGEIQALRGETAAWTRSMQAAIEGAQARLSGAEARLASLSARDMNSNSEINLAEVDYVLRLAQERLQLFGDTRTADHALQIADRHIAAFDNPMYIGVRQEIALSRQQLAGVEVPDFVALSQELDGVQTSLGSLPFRTGNTQAGEASAEQGEGWWARIRNAFSGLVTVRRSLPVEDELPVLADQELIRQRAWLEIETARLAAMRRDQESYDLAMTRASDTLQKWFEPGAVETQAAVQTLNNASQVLVDPPVPDISAAWTALQTIRGSGVPGPGVSQAVQTQTAPLMNNQDEQAAETLSGEEPEPEVSTDGDTTE